MKSQFIFAIVIFYLFGLNKIKAQTIPNKDSIISITLVSHKHALNSPLIRQLKRPQDIILFINIIDCDMYGFIDANYDLYGTISHFEIDYNGSFIIELNVNDRSRRKLISYPSRIEYKNGSGYFTYQKRNKEFKHTQIKCEFHNEKIFNVDYHHN
jgi:hypothetical protein